MGTLAKFVQDPDEVKRYTVSWADWLDVTEVINAAEFEISITNGVGGPIPLVATSRAISSDKQSVSFLISGGAANTTYKVTIRVDTSSAQIKEDCVIVAVRNC